MKVLSIVAVIFGLFLTGCGSSDTKEDNSKFDVKTVTDKGSKSNEPVSSALPNIAGNWKSPSPEPAGNGQYMTREYSINLSRWELTFTLAGNKEMKNPIYIFRAEGSYTIETPSSKVPGAHNAILSYSRKYLHLKSKDKSIVKELGFNNCKLNVGVDKDITLTGCDFYRSTTDCPQEFDLVKIEGGMLRLGERPADNEMCTVDKRPEFLGPALKKIN